MLCLYKQTGSKMINESDQIIEKLEMKPLEAEGGYFVQKYKSNTNFNVIKKNGELGERVASTAIYYLLKNNQISALHRLRSDEIWHYYGGDPITLVMLSEYGAREILVGPDILNNQVPQYVVMRETWFGAYIKAENTQKGYSLIGCTVSPGFEFEDFELGNQHELLKKYPNCSDVIKKLTNSGCQCRHSLN